jgi:hypothetical protein
MKVLREWIIPILLTGPILLILLFLHIFAFLAWLVEGMKDA